MNPLNYLHLSKPEIDIRGSHIGVYFRFDENNRKSSTLVINFQDGRWRRIIEEPMMRIKESLEEKEGGDAGRDPFYLQTIFVTSILRWWSNVLNSFNDQLIAYVSASPNISRPNTKPGLGGRDASQRARPQHELLNIEL